MRGPSGRRRRQGKSAQARRGQDGGRQGYTGKAERPCTAEGSTGEHPEKGGGGGPNGTAQWWLSIGLSVPEGVPGGIRGGQAARLRRPGRAGGHRHRHLRGPELQRPQHRKHGQGVPELLEERTKIRSTSPIAAAWEPLDCPPRVPGSWGTAGQSDASLACYRPSVLLVYMAAEA